MLINATNFWSKVKYGSYFIAAMTPNQQSAMNLYSAGFQFFMFFCGYSIPVSEVPGEWKWATTVSFARYSFESLAINEFAHEEDDDGMGGTYWLSYWGFDGVSKQTAYSYFVMSVAGFHVVAWLAMKVSFDPVALTGSKHLPCPQPPSPAESTTGGLTRRTHYVLF